MTEIIEDMSPSIDQEQLAQDLVEQARTQGLELMGPDGLLTRADEPGARNRGGGGD